MLSDRNEECFCVLTTQSMSIKDTIRNKKIMRNIEERETRENKSGWIFSPLSFNANKVILLTHGQLHLIISLAQRHTNL